MCNSAMRLQIYVQRPDTNGSRWRWLSAGSPEHCLHARHQLERVERLDQKVVRAKSQCHELVHIASERTQHDHRR